MGHDYFKELRSLLATREGEVCMKDKDHHMRHPRGHLGDRASAQGTRGCAWRDDQFGRGQNTVLGWSDPTFAHGSVAKSDAWGRSSPRGDSSPCFARVCRRILGRNICRKRVNKVKTVRITLCTFRTATSSPNARPTEFILKRSPAATIAKVTAQKRANRAGATPFFGSQSAQKICPGRSRPLLHSGAHVFSPRAKQPRSWPLNSQVPVKWASPPYFTATSPATSPSIEHGITEINQMNRPEERNCARPRPCLRRERPHPLTHGASRLPCGRSRPHRKFMSAFRAVASRGPRICQTERLASCKNTKGEASCLY